MKEECNKKCEEEFKDNLSLWEKIFGSNANYAGFCKYDFCFCGTDGRPLVSDIYKMKIKGQDIDPECDTSKLNCEITFLILEIISRKSCESKRRTNRHENFF